jgi:hypothetical protein
MKSVSNLILPLAHRVVEFIFHRRSSTDDSDLGLCIRHRKIGSARAASGVRDTVRTPVALSS